MRKKVGQEATEEMSAFKGVVNLFIVVLLYLSQCVMLSKKTEREVTPNFEFLSDRETANETALVARTHGVSTLFGGYLKR